jgi:hypothetical protein
MNRYFRQNLVEVSGVRTIEGGGTNASNAGQALLNLSGVSITGNQIINGNKIFENGYIKFLTGYTNDPFVPGYLNGTSTLKTVFLNSASPFTTLTPNANTTGVNLYFDFHSESNLTNQLDRHIRTQSLRFLTGLNINSQIVARDYLPNSTGVILPYTLTAGFFPSATAANFPLEERLTKIESSGVFALLSGQKIGIGTFEPSEKLHIFGNLKVDGAISGKSLTSSVDINNITQNFTFNNVYNSKLLIINATQNITGTITTDLENGYNVAFVQMGAGQLLITGQNGVTIRQRLNLYNTAGQYAIASLVHRGNNEYILYGDLA